MSKKPANINKDFDAAINDMIADGYKICPDCGKITAWDIMIWLDGKCTCPKCYEIRRNKKE